MTHAIVLVKATHEALPTLGETLADLVGVAEAYSVTGEWDFVAIVRVPRRGPRGRGGGGPDASGMERTQTMVAFEVFSQHDLEAMFSIGE